jgi:hypothetical protein
MQLVEQYAMVRGRLQPALRYIAHQPVINRYKLLAPSQSEPVLPQAEVLTIPATYGDIHIND